MANQKIWTRNYYNLLAAGYGSTHSVSNNVITTPTENIPCVRMLNGSYLNIYCDQHPSASSNDSPSCRGELCLVSTTLQGVFAYLYQSVSYQGSGKFINNNYGYTYPTWYVALGTGTGTATYEDYDLFSRIQSQINIGNVTQIPFSYDDINHKYTYGYKAPFYYSGGLDVDITEMGIYALAPQDYTANGEYCMIYHEMFENAITLQQNDAIEITLMQSVIQPNYQPYPVTP